jgi:hypothetical protein
MYKVPVRVGVWWECWRCWRWLGCVGGGWLGLEICDIHHMLTLDWPSRPSDQLISLSLQPQDEEVMVKVSHKPGMYFIVESSVLTN